MLPREHTQQQPINPDRLIRAADMLLEAYSDNSNRTPKIKVTDLNDAGLPFNTYTMDELIEAMSFLIRAGLVETPEEEDRRHHRRR